MQDQQIVILFNSVFKHTHNTQIIGGGSEPEYIPADDRVNYHRIIYTEDFSASALHEIAHWCIAGTERRLQRDYGYWYLPDGRNPQEQKQFEQVESKSQALEWVFAKACGNQFVVSADNLDSTKSQSESPSLNFKQSIVKHALRYCRGELNERATIWTEALYRQRIIDTKIDDSADCVGFLDSAHYCIKALG
jgi:elongation factor P hydroxylase